MAKEAASVGASGRPVLKGRHMAWAKKHLFISIGLAFAGVIAAKLLINEPRKKAYAEFYKNYDIDKDFNRIRNLGYFQSCGPD